MNNSTTISGPSPAPYCPPLRVCGKHAHNGECSADGFGCRDYHPHMADGGVFAHRLRTEYLMKLNTEICEANRGAGRIGAARPCLLGDACPNLHFWP